MNSADNRKTSSLRLADPALLNDLIHQVFEANMALPAHGLVTFTWGNVSGIDRESGTVVIKPSGVPYAELKPADMVLLNLAGEVLAGTCKPSSDTSTHLALYRAHAEMGGVVHTHSTYATAWAQAGYAITALGTTHADYFHGDVPCTRALTDSEIAGDYELATGDVINEAIGASPPLHCPGVLVLQHGPFTWGKDAADAVHNAVVLEEIARMAQLSHGIGVTPERMAAALMEKHFSRKHGPNAYYGQPR